jgi:hypothetical protein
MKRILLLVGILLWTGLFAKGAGAQAPCCSITAIDAKTGAVSAKVHATGRAFQFKVTDPKLFPSLRVGQAVYANLTAKQISLDGKSIVGSVVSIAPPPVAVIPQERAPVIVLPKGMGISSGSSSSGSSPGNAPAGNSGSSNPASGSSGSSGSSTSSSSSGATTASSTCSSNCNFEEDQRADSLTLQSGVDGICLRNAFGNRAITAAAVEQLNPQIVNGIKGGGISLLLAMPGIKDLSGANDPNFKLGVLWGSPAQAPGGTVYDGSDDLDWWYTPNPQAVGANRVPLYQLNANMTNKALVAGPGVVLLPIIFGGPVTTLRISNAIIHASVGATSVPLVSKNQGPPGHVPAEKLNPSLTSFNSMTDCAICGIVSAAALAPMPVPLPMVDSGPSHCTQNYNTQNSPLDVIVGGCTLLGGFIVSVNPTQPDTLDPTANPAGATTVYHLTPEASTHIVNCGATCMNADAYTIYFKLTTDRVIIK